MQPVDNKIREEILNYQGNVVISASAGTGKTYITIQRIIRDLNLYANYQSFAAITFTRKAAKEISDRLGPKSKGGFVGTNDNFVWQEIIQPFMYDAFGNEFKIEIKPDYTDGNQIHTFEQGVEKIKSTQMMCKYDNNHKNFSFQLAYKILQNSDSARKYLISKYFRIYIDEYQDSDVDMHKFFNYLSDVLKIPLFIVGDEKQSIYGWRGAYSEGFISLFTKSEFKKFELMHNFRSNQSIQNFSNIFMKNVRKNIMGTDFNEEVVLYSYQDTQSALNFIKSWIKEDLNCAFLTSTNKKAEKISRDLSDIGLNFIYIPASPLNDSRLESEHIWVARSVASYFCTSRYSEYDFFDEMPTPEFYEIKVLRKLLYDINVEEPLEDFNNKCKQLYSYLGYDSDTDKISSEIEVLREVITDLKYLPSYNQDDYIFTSGTIHSSKGLEYKQVILTANDYDLSKIDVRYLHYVAISRPKERLLILAKEGDIYNTYLGQINMAIKKTNKLGKELKLEQVIKIIT